MMASRVIPPAAEEEGAEEGGTAKATGSVISTRGRFVLGSFQRSPSWPSHQKTRYEMEQEEEQKRMTRNHDEGSEPKWISSLWVP